MSFHLTPRRLRADFAIDVGKASDREAKPDGKSPTEDAYRLCPKQSGLYIPIDSWHEEVHYLVHDLVSEERSPVNSRRSRLAAATLPFGTALVLSSDVKREETFA